MVTSPNKRLVKKNKRGGEDWMERKSQGGPEESTRWKNSGCSGRKHEVRNFYGQGDGTCRDATLPSARMGVLSRSGSNIRLAGMSMAVWPMVGAYACA